MPPEPWFDNDRTAIEGRLRRRYSPGERFTLATTSQVSGVREADAVTLAVPFLTNPEPPEPAADYWKFLAVIGPMTNR
jgi:hypothetical protein